MPGMFDRGNNFLQQAAPIAQGAQAFTQAYGQRQQQVHTMDMQDQEMAMKKQYYQAQMEKFKSQQQPTKIDMQAVMTNVNKFRAMKGLVDQGLATPEDLNKFAQGTIEDAETPGMASAYAKLLNAGGDQARYLNPAEAKLTTSLAGQYSVSDRIASQERVAGQKIQSAEKMKYEEMINDLTKKIEDRDLRLKELGYKGEVLGETSRHNKAVEDAAKERNQIIKNRPRTGAAARVPPEQASLLRQIEAQKKAISGSMGMSKMLSAKEKQKLSDDLEVMYDQYKNLSGKDLRVQPAQPASAPQSAGPAPMGGQGPLRIYESAERQQAPVGSVVRNSQGKLFKKTATGYLPIK